MLAFLDHLQYPFFQRTLVACIVVGAVCALFSTYVVLRRLVFATVALTQLSSAGLGLAALTGRAALPTSLAATIFGVGLLALVNPARKGRTDNVIALLYIGGWAASVLLFAVAERGDTEMAAILYGDILGVLATDIYAFLPVAVLVLALAIGLRKELLFVSFDPETASTYRLPVWLYDTVLFGVLGIVIVFAVKMLGLLLVFAFLVAPGTAALLYCRRMPSAMAWAAAFSAVMSLLGLATAAQWDLPPGPAVTAAGLVLLCLLWAVKLLAPLVPANRERRVRVRLDPEAVRVGLVVAAMVLVAGLAGALSGSIGAGRAHHGMSAVSHELGQPVVQAEATHPNSGATPEQSQSTPDAPDEGASDTLDYKQGIGDQLPNIDDLLGTEEAPPEPTANPEPARGARRDKPRELSTDAGDQPMRNAGAQEKPKAPRESAGTDRKSVHYSDEVGDDLPDSEKLLE